MYVTNGNQNNNGGLAVEISRLGQAIGLVASLMLTPIVFRWTGPGLYHYFTGALGRDYAEAATWITGAAEAYIIYSAVSIGITLASVWAVTAMIERGWRQ